MGEHAMGQDRLQAEGPQQVLQGPLDPGHLLRLAADRVGPQDDIAHAVGPAIENLPANVLRLVGGGIGLDPRPQVALGADLGPWQGVEDLGGERLEFSVGHQLDQTADNIAGEPRHQGPNGGLVLGEEKRLEVPQGPGGGDRLGLGIEAGAQGLQEAIVQGRVGIEIAQRGGGQQLAGHLALGIVVGGKPRQLIAFLEGIGRAQKLGVIASVPATAHTPHISNQPLPDLGVGRCRQVRRRDPGRYRDNGWPEAMPQAQRRQRRGRHLEPLPAGQA